MRREEFFHVVYVPICRLYKCCEFFSHKNLNAIMYINLSYRHLKSESMDNSIFTTKSESIVQKRKGKENRKSESKDDMGMMRSSNGGMTWGRRRGLWVPTTMARSNCRFGSKMDLAVVRGTR